MNNPTIIPAANADVYGHIFEVGHCPHCNHVLLYPRWTDEDDDSLVYCPDCNIAWDANLEVLTDDE